MMIQFREFRRADRVNAIRLVLTAAVAIAAHGISRGDDARPASTAPAATRPALTEVDLSRLEPAVADQFRSLRESLQQVIDLPETQDATVGAAYGEYGQLLHAYEFHTEAIATYREALARQPQNPRWPHLLGCAAVTVNDLDTATAALQSALQLAPDNVATQVHLARIHAQQNEPAAADRIFRDLLARDPDLVVAHAGLGELAMTSGDYAAAVKHLQRALELAPTANRIHYQLALAYRGMGELEQARQQMALRGSIGIKPFDPWLEELSTLLEGERVHVLRARAAFQAGAVEEAIREYREALKAAPDSVTAHVNLSAALAQMNQIDGALEHLAAALLVEPENINALYNSALLRSMRHDPSRDDLPIAEQQLRALLGLRPEDRSAKSTLAKVLVQTGRTEAAIQLLETFVGQPPDDVTSVVLLSDLYIHARRYGEAAKLLRGAYQRSPERGLTARALAQLLLRTPVAADEDPGLALDVAERVYAAAATPEHEELIAMALAANQRYTEAAAIQARLIKSTAGQVPDAVTSRLTEDLARYSQSTGPRKWPAAIE